MKRVFACMVIATCVCIVQDVRLLVATAPVDVLTANYAALSTVAYSASVMFGLLGRRRPFFWSCLTVAALQFSFVLWYLVSFGRLVLLLPATTLWNAVVLTLSVALSYYLLSRERPRVYGATRA
jgi:hypothetical protein